MYNEIFIAEKTISVVSVIIVAAVTLPLEQYKVWLAPKVTAVQADTFSLSAVAIK